jgi:hypothetical protein
VSSSRYVLYSSFWDLILFAFPRIGAAGYAIAWYLRLRVRPSRHQSLFHKDGSKKSRAELEDEANDEPCSVVCRRFLFRLPFLCALLVAATAIQAKCRDWCLWRSSSTASTVMGCAGLDCRLLYARSLVRARSPRCGGAARTQSTPELYW